MKIKMPLEKALFCPKHGRQIYYTTYLGRNPSKFCDRTDNSERKAGEVVAFVSKRGEITYTCAGKRIPKRVWENDKEIIYSMCFNKLSERMVMPKVEKLLGVIWKYEWSSEIWREASNRNLAVSGKKGHWGIYYPQFNTYDNNALPLKKQKRAWGGKKYKTRLQAMEAAIANWETLCKTCVGSGRHCKKVDCKGPCAACPPHPTDRTRSTGYIG